MKKVGYLVALFILSCAENKSEPQIIDVLKNIEKATVLLNQQSRLMGEGWYTFSQKLPTSKRSTPDLTVNKHPTYIQTYDYTIKTCWSHTKVNGNCFTFAEALRMENIK